MNTEQEITIGKYQIFRISETSVFVQIVGDGEGMEVSDDRMNDLLDGLWEDF